VFDHHSHTGEDPIAELLVVSLQPAAKYQRPAWQPSPGQKNAAHRAIMASQRPSVR
jgi:hypothetical protein